MDEAGIDRRTVERLRAMAAAETTKLEVRTHGGDVVLVFSEPVTNFRLSKSAARRVAAAIAQAALR